MKPTASEMRLSLTTGSTAGAARLIGSSRFRVGTYSGATWVLPRTDEGAGEVTIAMDRDGLSIRLTRGNASLDGRPLAVEAEQRLQSGAKLKIADHELVVGHADSAPSFRDPVPEAKPSGQTVTSILADVAPGGTTAQGPLPGRSGEDWLAELTGEASEASERAEWGNLGKYEGAEGVDAQSLPPSGGYLPDDWDSPGDAENKLEQGQVPANAMALGAAKVEAAKDGPLDPAVVAFLKGAKLTPDELDGATVPMMQAYGEMLRALLETLSTLEDTGKTALTELGEAPTETPAPHQSATATLLNTNHAPELTQLALTQRLADLTHNSAALMGGVQKFADAARTALDPEAILTESRATGGTSQKIRPMRAAWDIFLSRFEGKTNAGVQPLSNEALTHAIRDMAEQLRARERET